MSSLWRKIIPSKNDRELRRLGEKVAQINGFEAELKNLTDPQLQAKTNSFREKFEQILKEKGGDPGLRQFEGDKEAIKAERQRVDAALGVIANEAFAVVREAARRVLGMRHYDVQLLGGMVLHEGKIAEMKTGEGKTLMATLPVYLNALAGRGVHVITVNEYLAARDAEWMGQVYRFLGMDVGCVLHGISDVQRKAAYQAPITYGTNSEFGFDYLRDNMKLFLRDYVQRGAHYAIVDEVDSILIDEARTPLIISGPAEESTDKYVRINAIIPGLRRDQDYTVDEKSRSVVLTEPGIHSVEKRLGVDNLYEPDNIEILHHVNQALRAHTLYRRDVDYMLDNQQVKIIDEFTGRVMEGRRWSDGLHQAIEAKEGVRIQNENQTLATITYQNYFRNFLKLSGMTGTAQTEAEEFSKIYSLDVVAVPTNKPLIRDDMHDVVYKTEREKFEAIVEEVQERYTRGQPCLVGTISVEKSEVLSRLMSRLKIAHSVLNAKYHLQEAAIIAQAGRRGAVTIATNMAGRGTDILLGGNPEALARADADPEVAPEAYAEALAKYQVQCEHEKQEVLAAGGLVIIGSERHESRRIDNQLRGRAGRQGDPGASRFFVSLEDDLMRIFGGDRIKALMERLGMQEGEVIEHPWVNKSLENAQRRVEGHNFDIRKHLLEYDDVMNDQRKGVYKARRLVIGAELQATKDLLFDRIEDVILDLVARACPERSHVDEWDVHGLEEMVKEHFGLELELTGEDVDVDRRDFEDRIFKAAQTAIQEREQQYTGEAYYHVVRIIYLQTIDALWKDHLREMDHLREGISLRGYAQKDPKQEYKKEGYNLFASMMAAIAVDVVQKAFRVVITAETEEDYQARLQARRQEQQRLMQQSGGDSSAGASASAGIQAGAARAAALLSGGQGGPGQASANAGPLAAGTGSGGGGANATAAGLPPGKAPKQQPVRRTEAKVNRNDPCPCGSGKKYKKCCMQKNDLHP